MIKDEAMLTLLGSAVDGVLYGLHFDCSLWGLGLVLLRICDVSADGPMIRSAINMWQRLC